MLTILFWVIFIIAVILYFTLRPNTNAYISVTPFVLFMIDIAILGFKVFGFSVGGGG